MYGRWRVGAFPDEVWIARSFGAALPEGAEVVSPENAAWQLDAWLSGEGPGRHVLVEIAEELGAALHPKPDLGAGPMHAALRDALRQGVLRAYRVPVKLSGGAPTPKQPDQPKDEPTPKEQKTFVVIELVDDGEPPKPVPFKKYRIELPDASVREGQLDANGQARIGDVDPGTCKVSFPQFHGADWQPA